MRAVSVGRGARSYEVLVGPGALAHARDFVPSSARKAAVVTQAGIPVDVDVGLECRTFTIPDGEMAKSLATVGDLCRGFASWGLTRADLVVAVGGGVVTDTAGFAAAVYHRGTAVVHVATTLLAQIDAAIGGKTGVNIPEGKNLVGAFWPPSGVICDTSLLATLPEREFRSGLGEMAKYHFLGMGDLGDAPLEERIARCVELKAAVVTADEREDGIRATLNYGHTLAHALEMVTSFGLSHGEAVAIGLVFAADLAWRLERIDAVRVAEHEAVVRAYDLPDRIRIEDPAAVVDLMARDKKAMAGLTFVLDGPAGVEVVRDVDRRVVESVLHSFGR